MLSLCLDFEIALDVAYEIALDIAFEIALDVAFEIVLYENWFCFKKQRYSRSWIFLNLVYVNSLRIVFYTTVSVMLLFFSPHRDEEGQGTISFGG